MISGIYPVKDFVFKDGSCMCLPVRELKDYNLRVVRSGDIVEVYSYDKKVFYNYEPFSREYSKEKSDSWNGKDEKSLSRSRREIRRIIWSNLGRYSKFLTLTYADNMQDLEQFYFDWKMFTKTMKRRGYTLKYLYVLEFQERGAIHAHVVIFNDEYIPIEVIENAWGKGFVKINAIKEINNLGAYVCKYLTKESLSEYNSKSYSCSRGLKRPVERKITLQEGANLIEELLSKGQCVFSSQFDITVNDIITNSVEYNQIKLHKDHNFK